MTVQILEYDRNAEVTCQHLCEYVEQAKEWAEKRSGCPLEYFDTQIGYQLATTEQMRKWGEENEVPSRWYEIHGYEDDSGSCRELADEDHSEQSFYD